MDATSTSAKTSTRSFINRLKKDFPEFNFNPGNQDHWSPKTNTITYKSDVSLKEIQYRILH